MILLSCILFCRIQRQWPSIQDKARSRRQGQGKENRTKGEGRNPGHLPGYASEGGKGAEVGGYHGQGVAVAAPGRGKEPLDSGQERPGNGGKTGSDKACQTWPWEHAIGLGLCASSWPGQACCLRLQTAACAGGRSDSSLPELSHHHQVRQRAARGHPLVTGTARLLDVRVAPRGRARERSWAVLC